MPPIPEPRDRRHRKETWPSPPRQGGQPNLKQESFLMRLTKLPRSSLRANREKKSGWLYGHPVGGEVIVTIRGFRRTSSADARPSHWFMYSRLNASASARVRSASFIFLSLSVTSSTRAYTKSRIAARTASERLGKSSTSTRKSSAFR